MYRLLTIDVWDTLLRRRCHPDAVKLHVANTLRLTYADCLRDPAVDSRSLLALRLSIERELAHASAADPARDDEYALKDVIHTWIERACVTNPWERASMVERLQAEEFAQECEVTYADPGIRKVACDIPAERKLFLSDFYMSAERLAQILKAKGLSDLVAEGHSSCDHGLNKRSGRLFLAVQSLYGISPSAHAHLGDNSLADVKAPRRLGMAAYAYRCRGEESLRHERIRDFADPVRLVRVLEKKLGNTTPLDLSPEAVPAYRLGLQLSPLFAGFSLFVFEWAQREQLDRLYFLTREGGFLLRCYERLRAACPRIGARVVDPALLEVSRLSTFAASLADASANEMMRLWRGFPVQSVAAWALSLGMRLSLVAPLAARHGLPMEKPIASPWLDPHMRALLADSEMQALLYEHIASQRGDLMAYLESVDFRTGQRLGLVDIGWRGSMQDNLAHLFPAQRLEGCYMGLQAFHNQQQSNSSKRSFGPNFNNHVPERERRLRLFRNLPLLEMLCNVRGGSVSGYERDEAGNVQIRREMELAEDSALDVMETVQAGVLDGMDHWSEQIHCQAWSSADLRAVSLKIWAQMVSRPPPFIAKALLRVRHNELFGRGIYAGAADRPRLSPNRFRIAAWWRGT